MNTKEKVECYNCGEEILIEEGYEYQEKFLCETCYCDDFFMCEDCGAVVLEHYEDTYFTEHMENAGKASYVERNQEMINKSHYCIVYYDENYLVVRVLTHTG